MTPTPTEILQKLVGLCPAFEEYWSDEENLSREDNGSFTLCGLFSEFGHFIREHFDLVPEAARQELFDLVEVSLTNDDQDLLDSAVSTCFLENLSNEPPLSAQLRTYMGPKSRAFFDLWDHKKS